MLFSGAFLGLPCGLELNAVDGICVWKIDVNGNSAALEKVSSFRKTCFDMFDLLRIL